MGQHEELNQCMNKWMGFLGGRLVKPYQIFYMEHGANKATHPTSDMMTCDRIGHDLTCGMI